MLFSEITALLGHYDMHTDTIIDYIISMEEV